MSSIAPLKCGPSSGRLHRTSVPCAQNVLALPVRHLAPMSTSRRTVTARSAADPAVQLHKTNGVAPKAASASKDNFEGAMLEPAVANKQEVRALAVLGAVAVAAAGSGLLPSQAVAFVHVLAFATFFGTNLWNTFFVGLTMFKNMPRQMFGRVQSKLFPMYFALTTSANVLMIGTLVAKGVPMTAGPVVSLAIALASSLVNWLVLEPLCTGLMFQRYEIENKDDKSDQDKAQIQVLYKQFGKWHGISSLLNLIVFCVGAAHAWNIAGTMISA